MSVLLTEPGLEEIIAKNDLSPSDVMTKCAYAVRVRIAAQLVDWKMIAHYLGFAQVKIHTIHVDNENEDLRRVAFIEAWAEEHGDGATYLKLAEAFYEHGRVDLVDQLCKMIRRALRSGMQKGGSRIMKNPSTDKQQSAIMEDKRISLAWKLQGEAPRTMSRWCDAVVNGDRVYLLPGETYTKDIIVYRSSDNIWSEFCRHSRHTNSALTIINNALTTVGGGGFPYTNKLYSFTEDDQSGQWTEQLPPMPTRRQWTAVLNTGKELIVAGGWGSASSALATVEMMDIETNEWFKAENLPEPLFHASMTLCGDQVYILGGYDELKCPSSAVYMCSKRELLRTLSLASPQKSENNSQKTSPSTWKQIEDLPVTESTCVSLHGQLLAVGGRESASKSTTAVYKYNVITRCWEVISHMTSARHLCFAAVLPGNRLMVAGGESGKLENNTTVEVATSSLS